MNEEAVKTEENDDELWAFKWAQERKLRMKMELRLKGAIFEVGCLAGIAEETIKYLTQNNEKEVAHRLPTFIDFIFDAQNHIRLNLLSMLWEELDEHEKQYFQAAQPCYRAKSRHHYGVGYQRAAPIEPARPHLTKRKPVLEKKQIERDNAEQEKRISD